jgi:hypothetical protein
MGQTLCYNESRKTEKTEETEETEETKESNCRECSRKDSILLELEVETSIYKMKIDAMRKLFEDKDYIECEEMLIKLEDYILT